MSKEHLQQWLPPFLIALFLSFAYVFFIGNRAYVHIDLEVAKTTWFKIYWANDDGNYSEQRRVRIRVRPEKRTYSFFLTNLDNVRTLRVDTHQYEGEVILRKFTLEQGNQFLYNSENLEALAKLHPVEQIESYEICDNALKVNSSGKDPQLSLKLDSAKLGSSFFANGGRILFIFVVVWLCALLTQNYRDEKYFLPVCFTAILVMVMIMSAISGENVHPDEYVHLDASRYYMSNWLPPAVDSPDIAHTYSVYGVSRLNNREVAYFFTGQLARLLQPLKLPDYQNLRMFNLLLLVGLVLYIIRFAQARIVAVPFLLTPQIWYMYSYCNSDAFALTLAFLAACQVVIPDSAFNTFITTRNYPRLLIHGLLLSILLALLLLLKKNYYFFILFLGGYLLWRNFFIEKPDWWLLVKRVVVLGLVGMVLFGLRTYADYAVNGWDRAAKLSLLREELSTPLYKPSTPLNKKHIFLYRKARGHTLEQLVIKEKWFGKTFRTAFGMYGYFTVQARDSYYNLILTTCTLFFLFWGGAVLLRGGVATSTLLIWSLVCMTGLTAASLYHSWTADFQTQGRYLFPFVSILGVMLFHSRSYIPTVGYKMFVLSLFLISTYSFIYVGILQIPKATYVF